jgi:predicted ATPase
MKFFFRNFGCVRKATIELKPFTVIAGKNESGKSFILRALYAILSSFHRIGDKNLFVGKFTVGGLSAEKIEHKFRWVFQQGRIGNLVNKFSEEERAEIEIVAGKRKYVITIKQDSKRKIKISDEEIIPDIAIHYVNFIATPLILDLKKGMSFYRTMFSNNYGVPDIYWDIVNDIENVGIADVIEFEEIYGKIKNLMGGYFEYDQKEGFIFRKGKYKFNMNLVASGIKIFGLIQLLIERNLLSKNTFLLLEEPEVHLHPSLRFKLIDVLKLLSDSGAYVIFSTHSPEIIRYVEYLLRKKELTEKNTEVLHLTIGEKGSIGKREPLMETVREVLNSLTEDYFELVLREELEETKNNEV